MAVSDLTNAIMGRETDYQPNTIDEQIDAIDNSIVI
jgi:hypothetical protein